MMIMAKMETFEDDGNSSTSIGLHPNDLGLAPDVFGDAVDHFAIGGFAADGVDGVGAEIAPADAVALGIVDLAAGIGSIAAASVDGAAFVEALLDFAALILGDEALLHLGRRGAGQRLDAARGK